MTRSGGLRGTLSGVALGLRPRASDGAHDTSLLDRAGAQEANSRDIQEARLDAHRRRRPEAALPLPSQRRLCSTSA